MPSAGLADEYKLCRDTLEKETFSGAITGLSGLFKALGSDGPSSEHYGKVTYLRDVTLKFKEADKLMEAAGIAAKGAASATAIKKAASLKLLRHLYLVGQRGSQQIWVVSTPKAGRKFLSDELLDVKATAATVKNKLADVDEQFSAETKKQLCEAMQLARDWAESAKIVLAGGAKATASTAIVKRWFAAPTTSDEDLAKTRALLLAGFKKIVNALSRNQVVITDLPMFRGDSTKANYEAFVRKPGGSHERPRCIYIEQALFQNYEVSVLHDMKKNWARVLLHECTHTEVQTADKGYAYAGLGPGVKITAANAAINADSWAFFAADCAGALTDGDRLRALNGSGGTLKKLKKNWK